MKITNPQYLQLILLLAFLICSCKHKTKTTETQKIVNYWIGRTIKLPINNQCSILGIDRPCNFKFGNSYTILLYTDSSGCTNCKLRLDIWKSIIQESNTKFPGKVKFLFYFFSKSSYNLTQLLKKENFNNEVVVDFNDDLNKLNKFSKDMDFQCFLLDKNDKVITIGNPTFNFNIWELNKKIISGKINPPHWSKFITST